MWVDNGENLNMLKGYGVPAGCYALKAQARRLDGREVATDSAGPHSSLNGSCILHALMEMRRAG